MDTGTDAATAGTTTPGTTPAGTTDAGATGAASGAATTTAGDAAEVTGCETTIEGNDAMQFNVNSITIPASCNEFTINLEHTGQLPEAAMGHNVVITSESDMQAVAADGLSAGADNEYVPQDDDRVLAFTDIIGGGESTSVTFSTSAMQDGGNYMFFCSFPGHSALMKGTISVG
ncbi:azurin [Novilysobacter defluvii]|uniref:Azurin n=2 Tax=Novilysobacter TaxID=3382699 RepID=A0A0A0M995_9GAMM|nr:azurin [Lysobacter defluvii]KGO99613.1 azurin [Lysobacter defluvii IMMIB APB-9 = DSM 18482]